MRKSFFFPLLMTLTVVSVLVSCAPPSFVNKRDAGSLIGVTDLDVRWSPSKPAIGDLVHLEARLTTGTVGAAKTAGTVSDANTAGSVGAANTVGTANTGDPANTPSTANTVRTIDLIPPNGETISPLSQNYDSGGVTIRWSFRVKAAGDYVLGKTKLFSVISVAGTSTELKKFDANGLWNGRIEALKDAQQAAPQAVPQTAPQAAAQGGTAI